MDEDRQLQSVLDYLGIDTQFIANAVLTLPVTDLQIDSRKIAIHDLFIALRGQCVDGRDYIKQAIDKGASAVLSEVSDKDNDKKIGYLRSQDGLNIPIISIYKLKTQLSGLASFFYLDPSHALTLVGVTGTNGKTTVTQLLAQWVALLGQNAAIMGTIGNGIYDQLVPSENTTLSAVEVQSQLADFVEKDIVFVAMEVSSHGLVERRVANLSFNAVVFTNLTRDHLDFHHSMSAYALAKRSLFDIKQLAVKARGIAIINFDDETGREWLQELTDTVAFSIDPQKRARLSKFERFVGIKRIQYDPNGVTLSLYSSWGEINFTSALIGEFNIANLLAALATLLALNYPLLELVRFSHALRAPPGRMEQFISTEKPRVIVDYAHTPNALLNALQAAKQHCGGQLWVIFGCGGDRDKGKRPLMAKIAEKFADHIILTDDNPRCEDASQIIADIVQGFTTQPAFMIERTRAEAIEKVIRLADPNDTILVAGKGHEAYQIIGREKHYYSDRKTVANLLGVDL